MLLRPPLRLVGATVSLVLTQSYLFSAFVSNTVTTVYDLWRPEPKTCVHARRYLAYILTGVSWLCHKLGFGLEGEEGYRNYHRDDVHNKVGPCHLLTASEGSHSSLGMWLRLKTRLKSSCERGYLWLEMRLGGKVWRLQKVGGPLDADRSRTE